MLHTLPSTTLGEEMRKVENERLDKMKAGWSEEDWAENKLLNEKLVAWQQTPDTPEQLATLPVLDISAISEEPEFTPTEEKEVGGVKLLYHPVDTNGVVHVNAYFKLTDFAYDELSALSMLPRLLGNLPTGKHDALTLQQLVKRYVGRLEYNLYAFAQLDDEAECAPMLAVSCSVLEQNLDMAEELIVEILTGTDFEQSELIGKIATQAEIAARQIGVSSGHSLGILSVLSHYSANGAASDAVSGYKAIRWLKGFVGEARPMYERRSWGEYRVLDYKVHRDNMNSLTKELVIAADRHISYQRHRKRTEVWTFTEGQGDLILDGVVRHVERGDVAVIRAGMKHAIKAVGGELHIIEVQIGDDLSEDDIERLDWDW